MRYTAIALDFDGTIAHDSEVPAHVLEGLRRLRASGRKLLLVTGRELEELLGIFPEIGVFDLVVAENGALMYDPASRERKELGEPPPSEFVECLRASGIPLAVGHTIVATVRPHETVVLEAIANLGLEQQVIFNKGAVMVLPPGCNKASGLRVALHELGLSPRNCVAAGDGENDHALLDMAEYSVATANAIETLKEAADYVTRAVRGDGVLEVVEGLIEHDLARLPPRRRRRALCIGRDSTGREVILPSRRASLVVAGAARTTTEFARALLERLCKAGYQVAVLDTRGAYAGFKSAVVFGTPENPPAVDEVLTALEKPDVQTVVSLAAVPLEERPRFVEQLLGPLRELREQSGRPHWILVDEASQLLPARSGLPGSPEEGAENTLFVAEDVRSLSPAVLNAVDGIAACGDDAEATLSGIAQAVSWPEPPLPGTAPREGQALIWFRGSEQRVALIDVAVVKAEPASTKPEQRRETSAEVGQVLRQA
jgi:hydroxymethylpyrimidine pyrophosphatase-like HAD family hydrolase